MNIFFDVDYTILGADRSLRPYTRHVFERLVTGGHDLYIWSGRGDRTEEVRIHGLEYLVTGLFTKPLYDFESSMEELNVSVIPDFVVDDHIDIVEYFGGFCVHPYYGARYEDEELLMVLALFEERAE